MYRKFRIALSPPFGKCGYTQLNSIYFLIKKSTGGPRFSSISRPLTYRIAPPSSAHFPPIATPRPPTRTRVGGAQRELEEVEITRWRQRACRRRRLPENSWKFYMHCVENFDAFPVGFVLCLRAEFGETFNFFRLLNAWVCWGFGFIILFEE